MPLDDGWDWPWLYYSGVTVLGMSEHDFWHRLTPRKLKALMKVHTEYRGAKAKENPIAFIDELM